MADKKITELTSLTELSGEDLFVVVDDPNGTPITKKMTAEKVLSGLKYVINATAATDTVGVKAIVTSNVAAASAGASVRGAEFIVNALATSTNTATQYGIVAKSLLSGATANVKSEHAAGKFVLDVSNSATLATNTYGLILEVGNTGVRVANVTSFMYLKDAAANSTTAQTLYFFDANGISINTTSGNVNSGVMLANSQATATHRLKVRVNGTTYYVLLSDSAT